MEEKNQEEKKNSGLTIPRHFTQPNAHPYDSIVWEKRDAVITGKNGEEVFRQNSVEVPAFWSQTATNIVASKYFRGQIGAENREWKVKQLINRVVDTITKWGSEGGYFTTTMDWRLGDCDSKIFSSELKYLLAHQYMAFNSPVNFNIGWKGRSQACSACYLTAADDTMESILDLYKIEGMLFKDGSGSGSNLSNLRSSQAPLSSGGKSSGPVAFMKGLDASAGSVKSGGSTRRAALMRVLDVDHPDILEFIECKADAEHKAHALIDAGFDGMFNVPYGAYDAVPFQNANHSVRVTDEFMRRQEKPTLHPSVKGIFRHITEAAWACGDPGLQFKETINKWNKVPHSGEIRSSNPCIRRGMKILTKEGWWPIEEVAQWEKERQWLFDGFDFIPGVVFQTGKKDICRVHTDTGRMIDVTRDHLFYVRELGWTPARDLVDKRVGLLTHYMRGIGHKTLWEKVVEVETLRLEDDVYDFSCPTTNAGVVENFLVHNCGEFLMLDWTSCNLLSLNLLKFLKEDGTFDIEGFQYAVDIAILAQEILISQADYPTPKIADETRKYRPLGLGYANLGAFLMSLGLSYDSEDGREYAAAITALMTGQAYKRSAEIAQSCGGPFAGFEQNKQPMLAIVKAYANNFYNCTNVSSFPRRVSDIILAARKSWSATCLTGEYYGFRNCEVTCLAPTGCLVGGSLITTERGLVRLHSLGDTKGEKWQPLNIRIHTDEGPRIATDFYINGRASGITVETKNGFRLRGTPTHKIKIINGDGEWIWKHLAELNETDIVPLALGQMVGESRTIPLPAFPEAYSQAKQGQSPFHMDTQLAEFVGFFMANGSLHEKGMRLCVYYEDEDVIARLVQLGEVLFDLKAHTVRGEGYTEISFHSTRLRSWWGLCGFAKTAPATHEGKGYDCHIPDAILETNDPIIYGAFLRGLFEGDGTVNLGLPSFSNKNREFIDEVKSLCLSLGFPTTIKCDIGGFSGKPVYCIRLLNREFAAQWMEIVGFVGARKRNAVQTIALRHAGNDYIPFPRPLADQIIPIGHPMRDHMVLMYARHGSLPRSLLRQMSREPHGESAVWWLSFYYDVSAATTLGESEFTYDLSVPENNTYIANGFISHNTIGLLMDCDTLGVEPAIALVAYKTLVGGGTIKLVNQTIDRALIALGGYSPSDRDTIGEYVRAHDTIEGCPILKAEHLPVFDCALPSGEGTRFIEPMGHVRMVAAVQPFVSMGISKTINIPHSSTPEDIADLYYQAWQMGLKAISVYRDGCKRSQPLSTHKVEGWGDRYVPDTHHEDVLPSSNQPASQTPSPVRHRLPTTCSSIRHKFNIAGHEGYVHAGSYDDGSLGEVFLTIAKEGSTLAGVMDALATVTSLALQYGVPLETLVEKMSHSSYEPAGFTGDPDIPLARSITDYVFRWLGKWFVGKGNPNRITLRQAREIALGTLAEVEQRRVEDYQREAEKYEHAQSDCPLCQTCGGLMTRSGTCLTCTRCGSTTGGCS